MELKMLGFFNQMTLDLLNNFKMKKTLFLILTLLVITSCSTPEQEVEQVIPQEENTPVQENYPDSPPTLTPDSEREPLPTN